VTLRAVAAITTVLFASGCGLLPISGRDVPAELPQPCLAVYDIARCQAMTDAAAAEVGKNRDDVTAVAIVPDPPPEGTTLGGAWPIRVRISLSDGQTHDARLCGGVSLAAACSEDPRLEARSVVGGGYHDHPCGVDPDDPSACAPPLPTIDPAATEAAQPISIDHVSIRIDRLGEQGIAIGEGSLPNGIWTAGEFRFADPWPEDLALRDATVVLEVRSLERDGKPFDNYYLHGWRAGVERVRAVLRFDVLWFRPGATLEIRNVVVR